MPEIEAVIQYGDIADLPLIDEPNLLVQSLEIVPARDKQSWKGGNKAIRALQYTNPTLTFQFDAIPTDPVGLANQHPGTQVDELENFAGNIYQFDPDQGIMVYEDPSRTLSIENAASTKFNVVHYPYIGESSSTWISDPEPTTIPGP